MKRKKVRLSKKGSAYLKSQNCSAIVGAVLRSIHDHTAEVLDIDEHIIRVKLSETNLPEDFINNNDFAVHREHLTLELQV